VELRAITWNLFHGRDFPPDRALFTWRSRFLRRSERNATHVQVNRDLFREFATVLAEAEWDVALLQECPPRWARPLATACGALHQRSLTSRNWLGGARAAIARRNPDLMGSWEGGSNLTLVRGPLAVGGMTEQRELVVRSWPERRTMAFAGLASGVCAANLHASTGAPRAAADVQLAAGQAIEWAAGRPLMFGGDLNLRPEQTDLFDRLARDGDLRGRSAPNWIDHLLHRDMEPVGEPESWHPGARELPENGLALRLSDHDVVQATFEVPLARTSPGSEP
jgi:endonuclease/exonuclease/phosphatase family metal-dependent hydrolase